MKLKNNQKNTSGFLLLDSLVGFVVLSTYLLGMMTTLTMVRENKLELENDYGKIGELAACKLESCSPKSCTSINVISGKYEVCL